MNSNNTIISGSNSRGRNIVTAVLRGNRKIRLPPYSLSAVCRKEEEAEIEEGLLHSKWSAAAADVNDRYYCIMLMMMVDYSFSFICHYD